MEKQHNRLRLDGERMSAIHPMAIRFTENNRKKITEYCKKNGISCNFAMNSILEAYFGGVTSQQFIDEHRVISERKIKKHLIKARAKRKHANVDRSAHNNNSLTK